MLLDGCANYHVGRMLNHTFHIKCVIVTILSSIAVVFSTFSSLEKIVHKI